LDTKSKAISATRIVIVILCTAVMAGALFFVFSPVPVLAFKAPRYAREVADRSGDRGQAAKNLLSLGMKALPYAIEMLKSDDYTTRKYGISIIRQLREEMVGRDFDAELVKAADAILEMLPREDVPRNRTEALRTIARLCYGRCQYAARIVRYFDDPSEEVRDQMGGTMQAVIYQYLPDQDTQWWKDFYEKNKAEFEATGKLIESGKIPPLGSDENEQPQYKPSVELTSPEKSPAPEPPQE